MQKDISNFNFSIIIPTYQRKDLVVNNILALKKQTIQEPFEVVCVVDGSTDGTAEALRSMNLPFNFKVIEQENQGLAISRNKGVQFAKGKIALFLDDDMEAHPDLLISHLKSFQKGFVAVLGNIPLHPKTSNTAFSKGIANWVEDRTIRIKQNGITFWDIWGGNMSILRDVFNSLGGFDPDFTKDGGYGNEDIEFGYRLIKAGYKITFNLNALSWQHYYIKPIEYIKRGKSQGCADVILARKHPTIGAEIKKGKSKSFIGWYFVRNLAKISMIWGLISLFLYHFILFLFWAFPKSRLSRVFLFKSFTFYYWRGVKEAGGLT